MGKHLGRTVAADKNGPEHEHKQHNPVFPTSRTGY
ncbi:hypothetical protein JOC76_006071 [Neobacillus cucumis]|nr:hypothetical protein [Neobacillus cucumis]